MLDIELTVCWIDKDRQIIHCGAMIGNYKKHFEFDISIFEEFMFKNTWTHFTENYYKEGTAERFQKDLIIFIRSKI